MISIKNRKMLIPNEERYIGTTFDDNSEVRTFKISRYTQTDIDLSAFTAKADIFHCDTETTDRADLEMEVQAKYILLHLYITKGMVTTPGTRLIDLKLFNDDGEVKWSSYKGAFYVEDPFATPQATQENLTELEQLEARINRAIATANEKAIEAAENWLNENVHPETGYVIDKSLRITGAAADAKIVGDAIASEAALRANADSAEATARQSAISAEALTRAAADQNLQAQVNQIIAPSGEAPSAAEVQNARIGADNVTYSTLGDAIRTQVTDLKNALNTITNNTYPPSSDSVPVDISSQSSTAGSGTAGGITWTKNSENNWTAVGTATGSGSFRNIIGSTTSLLERFYGGQVLKIFVNTTSPNLKLNVRYTRTSTQDVTTLFLTSDAYIKLPDDIASLLVRLAVQTGDTVDGTISFSIIGYYNTYIRPTADNTDRTDFIKKMLDYGGSVRLAKGTFYVKNLVLDEGQSISGEGMLSVLRLADNGNYAVKMNSRTKVSNLRIIGADEDIEIPGSDYTPERGETNILEGTSWSDADGYSRAQFPDGIPAGTYEFYLNATSDRDDVNYVVARFCDTTTYGTTHIIEEFFVEKEELIQKTLKFDVPCKSIWIFAASTVSASSGYIVNINSAEMYEYGTLIGNRNGIVWETPSAKYGTVTNCLIERFNGAGFLARNTGTGVDSNLYIAECFIRNCVAGLYVQRNSEFLRICNNNFNRNHYGILTRGGNNYISNCSLDANVIDLQVDNEEGSNGGHGAISNCSIAHADGNTGYGIIIKGTGRELVSNCNFYYSKIRLKSTNGNVLTGCGFGNSAGIEVDAGSANCNIITGCMFKTATGAITNTSGRTKVSNCWTRTGTEVALPI